MRLREFSDEDIIIHALSNGGRNIRVIFKEILEDYSKLINEYDLLLFHRTLKAVMEKRLADLLDRVVDMHNICKKSEDDDETRNVASELKKISKNLNLMLDSIQ